MLASEPDTKRTLEAPPEGRPVFAQAA